MEVFLLVRPDDAEAAETLIEDPTPASSPLVPKLADPSAGGVGTVRPDVLKVASATRDRVRQPRLVKPTLARCEYALCAPLIVSRAR